MMRQTLVMATIALTAMAGQTYADVEGGIFTGTAYYAESQEQTDFESLEFRSNGTFVETFNSIPYPGEYDETSILGIISFWNGNYTGIGLEDYQLRGISLFGFVTLYTNENTADSSLSYGGLLFRDGDADEPVIQ